MKSEDIKDKIKNKILALASVDDAGKPHPIAVEVNDLKDNKIIITDNFMKTTIENIKESSWVSLLFWENGEGFRIDGKAEYHSSGKWFDFVKGLKENKCYSPKGAVIVNILKIEKLAG